MNVVIVGGSLSALLHAIICRAHGHKVHILEKSSPSMLQSQAAGIRAGPEVQRLIKEYLKINKPYATESKNVEVVDVKGDIINTIPSPDVLYLTTWSILSRLLKSQLLDNADTTESVQQAEVLYETNQLVRDVQYTGNKVVVSYSNTETGASKSVEADLVIAADGGHSFIRRSLIPNSSPKYAGYVTWRGAVPESEISEASRKLLRNRTIFFRTDRGYTLSYHVPSETGSLEDGDCQFIWVWYETMDEDSEEFRECFTDNSGKRHLSTIPRGKMQPSVWAKKLSSGTATLSKPFAELLEKTTDPFISAIRDSHPSQGVFHDGKLLLVGDAFALFRPHYAMSTNQAAKQALGLAEVFKGTSDLSKWETNAIEYAKEISAFSIAFGQYCFTGKIHSSLEINPDKDTNDD